MIKNALLFSLVATPVIFIIFGIRDGYSIYNYVYYSLCMFFGSLAVDLLNKAGDVFMRKQ